MNDQIWMEYCTLGSTGHLSRRTTRSTAAWFTTMVGVSTHVIVTSTDCWPSNVCRSTRISSAGNTTASVNVPTHSFTPPSRCRPSDVHWPARVLGSTGSDASLAQSDRWSAAKTRSSFIAAADATGPTHTAGPGVEAATRRPTETQGMGHNACGDTTRHLGTRAADSGAPLVNRDGWPTETQGPCNNACKAALCGPGASTTEPATRPCGDRSRCGRTDLNRNAGSLLRRHQCRRGLFGSDQYRRPRSC